MMRKVEGVRKWGAKRERNLQYGGSLTLVSQQEVWSVGLGSRHGDVHRAALRDVDVLLTLGTGTHRGLVAPLADLGVLVTVQGVSVPSVLQSVVQSKVYQREVNSLSIL